MPILDETDKIQLALKKFYYKSTRIYFGCGISLDLADTEIAGCQKSIGTRKLHYSGDGVQSLMKRKVIIIGCFVLVFFLFFVRKINIFQPQSVVLPAITKDIANGMLKENECYIVRVENTEYFDIDGWYYLDGAEKKPVILIGRHPINELSYIFREANRNSFLVKGYMNEELTQYHNKSVFCVEEWYLIAPIKRDYGQADYREEEQRFFYPKNYLDAFDVEQGDYYPTHTYDLIWDRSESYYLKQEGYYKIRSRWNGSELEWFLVYDKIYSGENGGGEMRHFEDGHVEKKIYIEGNSPEYLLGATILNKGYNDQKCRDYFIVKGKMENNEDGVEQLEIYKWWIKTPFIHEDNSGIKIKSSNGFSRSDIEAGIYKNYR